MRWVVPAILVLSACGPFRGHTPPRGDSLETQHLPSKEHDTFVSPALIPADAVSFEERMNGEGWVLVDKQEVGGPPVRYILSFRRPRKP